jgi:hypothetical protein
LHQPGNERFNLLRWHRAGTEDERVTFLSLVLLWVNVKLLALHYSRTLDSLPRGAINVTEDHIDLILLDELSSLGFRYTICSCTVLKVQIYLPPQQATHALMSLMTILATFALAMPKNESAPVWSVITPTLMDRPTEVVDSFMAFSQPSDGKVHEIPIDCIRQDTAMVTRGFFVLLFYTGFGVLTLMLPIIRDLPHIDPQKIGNPVLWLAVALAVT